MPANYEPGKQHTEFDGLWEEDEQLWQMLSSYADGEALPEEMVVIERLLNEEPTYRHDLAFLQRVSDDVRVIGDVEPPAFLRDAILAKTVNRPTVGRRVAQTWMGLRRAFAPQPARYALAGAMAAGLALFLIWPRNAAQTPEATGPNVATNRLNTNVSPQPPAPVNPPEPQATSRPNSIAQTSQDETQPGVPTESAARPDTERRVAANNPVYGPTKRALPTVAKPTAPESKPLAVANSMAPNSKPKTAAPKESVLPKPNTKRLVARIDPANLPKATPGLIPASYRPGMDANYQRNLQGTPVPSLPEPDVQVEEPTAPPMTPDTERVQSTDTASPSGTTTAAQPKVMVGRLSLPDMKNIPSLQEMRQRRQAMPRSYDTPAINRPTGGVGVYRF